MSEPYLSAIKIFAFNFAPRGWADCSGQLLAISQNSALFSLLGTQYGGDGRTTFGLPDLRGRTGIHFGQGPGLPNYQQGAKSGEESHTLSAAEIPAHNHIMVASGNTADLPGASGNLLAKTGSAPLFSATQNGTAMAVNTVANAGNGQAHNNLPPYLAVNYCIALVGLFPSRN